MPARRSRSHRTVALTIAATVAGSSVALTAPPIAHATPTRCAATFNLFIPGTWETDENADPTQPVGMLRPVAEALKSAHGNRAEVYTLPYMARAFDNGHTYADSKTDAVSKATQVLAEVAESCPNTTFTITGYSQGADAAGDVASDIGNGNGPIDPDRVLAVGLLADPGAGTSGAATVGPRTSGHGIADPRPHGMGALSGRVASICDPGDLYCSIDKGSSPLLGSLGSILSTSPGTRGTTGAGGGTSPLAAALTSDFSDADLPALAANITALGGQLAAPTVDLGQVASTATSIANTLAPLTDLINSGAANPAANGRLAAAPTGSAERYASDVLTRATQSDLEGALGAAADLTDAANTLTGGNPRLPSTAPEIQTLATAAHSLRGQIAPLTSTPVDALTSASSVLSVLKPTVVVDQVLNVATGVTSLDMPGILTNLTLLPQKVAALDAHGAHRIAGELNNQFAPLVTMAAAVDLKWVSQVLAIIPDPTGGARLAALVASILANVDVIRLADLVGQIQEIAWTAVEKLLPPPGQLPDPLGAGAAMTALVPVGLDLASVATTMLTGTATTASPELLGTQASAASTSITTQAENLNLSQLSTSLVELSRSQGAKDLATLVGEGLGAASFFASGAHTNYHTLVVDNAGRTATGWLADWLTLQIGRAA